MTGPALPPSLQRLWKLAAVEHAQTGCPEYGCFLPVGLRLWRELEAPTYACSPANGLCFAETGGDGVHFSFLTDVVGCELEDAPILMTVPGASETLVVGKTLIDFFALGSRFGFFVLEQIVYEPAAFWADYQADGVSTRYGLGPESEELLTAIRREFQVDRWPNAAHRFEQLQDRFRARVQQRPPEPMRVASPPPALDFFRKALELELNRPEADRDQNAIDGFRTKIQDLEDQLRRT